jgi:hypothetical protein
LHALLPKWFAYSNFFSKIFFRQHSGSLGFIPLALPEVIIYPQWGRKTAERRQKSLAINYFFPNGKYLGYYVRDFMKGKSKEVL